MRKPGTAVECEVADGIQAVYPVDLSFTLPWWKQALSWILQLALMVLAAPAWLLSMAYLYRLVCQSFCPELRRLDGIPTTLNQGFWGALIILVPTLVEVTIIVLLTRAVRRWLYKR